MTKATVFVMAFAFVILCWPAPQAEACSCPTHYRRQVTPISGSKNVSAYTHIYFVNIGFWGSRLEKHMLDAYRLYRFQGKKRISVPIQMKQIGNLVICRPKSGKLLWNTRYHLDFIGKRIKHPRFGTHAMEATPITNFWTAKKPKKSQLPNPKSTVRVYSTTLKAPAAKTAYCSGRTSQVIFEMTPFQIKLQRASSFYWELQTKVNGKWTAKQAVPLYRPSIGNGGASLHWNVQVGYGQCDDGPVFTMEKHDVRIALVRSDGKRWWTHTRKLHMFYPLRMLPVLPKMPKRPVILRVIPHKAPGATTMTLRLLTVPHKKTKSQGKMGTFRLSPSTRPTTKKRTPPKKRKSKK